MAFPHSIRWALQVDIAVAHGPDDDAARGLNKPGSEWMWTFWASSHTAAMWVYYELVGYGKHTSQSDYDLPPYPGCVKLFCATAGRCSMLDDGVRVRYNFQPFARKGLENLLGANKRLRGSVIDLLKTCLDRSQRFQSDGRHEFIEMLVLRSGVINMAQKLIVEKFGPIKSCEIELHRFMTFIGPQSSGKSTIIKLMYFFLSLRDDLAVYLTDRLEAGSDAVKWKDLEQRFRIRFLEFWGPTIQDREMRVHFQYAHEITIEVTLDKHRQIQFTKFDFSKKLSESIEALQVRLGRAHKVTASNRMPLFATPDLVAAQRRRATLVAEIQSEVSKIFGFSKQLLFIPAGRSLLSTVADQLANIDRKRLDYPLHQFIERINYSKPFFDRPLSQIVEEQKVYLKSRLDEGAIKTCRELMAKILKGEFRQTKDEGRLYFSKSNYTKINYASSGQQESVWILLLIFLITLEATETILFVEEPEAHLFPEAQKHIVDLLTFAYGSLGCDLIVTTHSPYILGAINNCLYAHLLASSLGQSEVSRVIPSKHWIDPKDSTGWYVHAGELTSIVDDELRFLDTSLVDSAADIINNDYERLLEMYRRGGN
ncbi:AAA family ATPase [Burkholderia gladioli]|uniref:AAA family ATPase n=1 Tax=Burkholderia gladioli TaxID=28095 RepID=UPI00163FED4E|nr:AAA family ATPase [Burkholderia gladioli]